MTVSENGVGVGNELVPGAIDAGICPEIVGAGCTVYGTAVEMLPP